MPLHQLLCAKGAPDDALAAFLHQKSISRPALYVGEHVEGDHWGFFGLSDSVSKNGPTSSSAALRLTRSAKEPWPTPNLRRHGWNTFVVTMEDSLAVRPVRSAPQRQTFAQRRKRQCLLHLCKLLTSNNTRFAGRERNARGV